MQLGLKVACTLAIAALTLGLSTAVHADPLKVKTEPGKVHGKTINDGKVKAFLGLPYAAPPVGDLRWKAPEPPAKWKGVHDATKFGGHCFQGHIYNDMTFPDAGESEDCLYLNVYAPAGAKSKSRLPVMFWIYGGGFAGGSASEPRHNGDFLPTKGVVLVTINYRLAVGLLAQVRSGKKADGGAGNYGLMDMVAALQWVKDNIRKFGGDPDNVTIFGESAGSIAVCMLMASPMAKGLFHKAIGESGGALSRGIPGHDSLAEREKMDEEWVATLGVTTLAQLRALPAKTILESSRNKSRGGFGPDVDGKLLTEPVADTYAAGRQAHVPLLAGWNRDEGNSDGMTAEKWKAFAAEQLKENSEEFLKLYPGETDEQAARSAADFNGDMFIAFGTWKWIEAHRETGDSPVYRYRFDLPSPPSKFEVGGLAFHSDDIAYVFGTLDTRPGAVWRPEDRKLSDQMMDYWTNFARTGDPNGPGLPVWPKYGKDDALIHLDSTITAGPDTLRPRYEFLLKIMAALGSGAMQR